MGAAILMLFITSTLNSLPTPLSRPFGELCHPAELRELRNNQDAQSFGVATTLRNCGPYS